MKRRLIVAGAIALLAMLLLAVPEFNTPSGRLGLQPTPSGFLASQFWPARSLETGLWSERVIVGYEEVDNPGTVVGVGVSTYRTVALRYLLGYMRLRPPPSFPNFELRIDSPKLEGVGYGEDTIQCGDGQPASCSAWVYRSVRGNQIAGVTVYVDLFEGRMSADEFRDLVRSVLTIEGR